MEFPISIIVNSTVADSGIPGRLNVLSAQADQPSIIRIRQITPPDGITGWRSDCYYCLKGCMERLPLAAPSEALDLNSEV